MKSLNSSTLIPDEKPKTGHLGWKGGILLMIVVVALVGALYLGFTAVTAKPVVQPVQLNGYFIDVNGDGKLDYVVSSEVIINTGQLNLTPSP
jgi:hypothetical protein